MMRRSGLALSAFLLGSLLAGCYLAAPPVVVVFTPTSSTKAVTQTPSTVSLPAILQPERTITATAEVAPDQGEAPLQPGATPVVVIATETLTITVYLPSIWGSETPLQGQAQPGAGDREIYLPALSGSQASPTGTITATVAVTPTRTVPAVTPSPTITATVVVTPAEPSAPITATAVVTPVQPAPTATATPTTPITPTVVITPTDEVTSTAKVVKMLAIYVPQAGTPVWAPNFIQPEAGCNWMGVAGQVFDEDGQAVPGLVVQIIGHLDSTDLLAIGVTGSAPILGSGGYLIKLAQQAVASQGSLYAQLFDLNGNPLSGAVMFDTFANCEKNLILINFLEVEAQLKIYLPVIRQ